MVAGFRSYVPPITGDPNPHGLLGGCIEVVTDNDMHRFNGTQVLSLSCADSNLWYQCDGQQTPTTPANPASKVFNRPKSCEYEPVTVYNGVECSVFGLTDAEFDERALEGLRMGEQTALERYVMTQILCHTAVDLTSAAGALHIAQGVGVLESWLAANYGGVGVLHVPIGAAALLSASSLVDFATEETCPRTLAGNRIVLGAGYAVNVGPTDCTAAPSGETWIYITPPMRIRRDTPSMVPLVDRGIDTKINDRRSLAETTFVPEIACCMSAAVRVSLTVCP